MTSDGVRLVMPGDIEVDPNLVSALRTPDEQDGTAAGVS